MLWMLLACGYSPDEFEAAYADAFCSGAVECGVVSQAECEQAVSAFGEECASIDQHAAQRCLDGVAATDCDGFLNGTGAYAGLCGLVDVCAD